MVLTSETHEINALWRTSGDRATPPSPSPGSRAVFRCFHCRHNDLQTIGFKDRFRAKLAKNAKEPPTTKESTGRFLSFSLRPLRYRPSGPFVRVMLFVL